MSADPPPSVHRALLAVALIGFTGCADDARKPTEPVPSRAAASPTSQRGALPQFPEMVALVPAVRLGALDGPRAELTDADLVDAVTRAGGKVLIGFKPALAARSGETGVMPAIDRATALAARATVRGLGAQITMSFRHSGGVAATIPPAIAPALRRLAVVDHVEPAFPGQLTQATPPQDTSWGVRKINAHLVWPTMRCAASMRT